jgi:hypothetical protein
MKKLTKIQESARNEQCTFNLGVCNYDTTTTVLCHDTRNIPDSPRKSDARAAYGCSDCHDVMDERTTSHWKVHQAGYEWGRAIAKTHVRLIQKGLLRFEGIEPTAPKQLPRKGL